MHIPDGFLDAKTALTTAALSLVGVSFAFRQVRRQYPPNRVPLLGLAAAFVFAAQMLNFPVAGGTSGHLIGGVMVAVLLGPGAAVVAMSSVLILQCFLFADGGVSALGANLFNMAIVAPIGGYAVYRLVRRFSSGLRGQLLATAFAAWCAVVLASIACAGQLALSGTAAWRVVFPAMAGLHMLIGIGEALITTLVVAAVYRTRPELLAETTQSGSGKRFSELAVLGMVVSIGMVICLAPLASAWPDGLEKVAAMLGFEHMAATANIGTVLLPDYAVPGVGSAALGTVLAGIVGTAVAFAISYLLARALTPRDRPGDLEPEGSGLP